MTDEDQARLDYLKWFVKRHYVLQAVEQYDTEKYRDSVHVMRRAEAAKGLFWTVYERATLTYEEMMCPIQRPYTRWFVNLTDLNRKEQPEDPAIAEVWEHYQLNKKRSEDLLYVRWLDAESEFELVTAEAKLRSYGIPVVSA